MIQKEPVPQGTIGLHENQECGGLKSRHDGRCSPEIPQGYERRYRGAAKNVFEQGEGEVGLSFMPVSYGANNDVQGKHLIFSFLSHTHDTNISLP